MKIVGVPAEALGKLHDVVKNDRFKTQDECFLCGDDIHTATPFRHPYAQIQDSKFSSEHGTYTVTVKLNLKFVQRDKRVVFTAQKPAYNVYVPIEALQAILQAMDQNLLPSGGECSVPTAEEVERLKMKREDWRYNHILPDLEHLVGKKFHSDIFDGETLEIIVPADRKITRALVWKLLKHIDKLDFSNGTDDVVVPALRQAREKDKAMIRQD